MSRVAEYQRSASDVVSWHQDQALQTRILLLHPTGPFGFVLMDTEENQRCKVLLGDPHCCSCKTFKRERSCRHVYWVLLKKFKVPRTDPVSFQLGLVERELQAVLNGLYCKPKSSRTTEAPSKAASNVESSDPDGRLVQRQITDDDSCPICQEEFLTSESKASQHHEPVTYCKFGCGQNIHIKCMKSWASYQKSSLKESLECPLCRADFGTLRSLMEELQNAQAELGKVSRGRMQRCAQHCFTCNNCGMAPIEGKCYKCRSCAQFYLCQGCFNCRVHMHHNFEMRHRTNERWIPVDRGFLINGKSVNESNAVSQLLIDAGLQSRDLSENDYDILLRLDEAAAEQTNQNTAYNGGSTLSEGDVILLPSMTIKKQHVHLLKPGMQCNICLQAYRIGQAIRRLPCRHKFHQTCIDGHLLHQSDCCPLCSEPIRVEKPDNQSHSSSLSSAHAANIDSKKLRKNDAKTAKSRIGNNGKIEFRGNDGHLETLLTVFGQSELRKTSLPDSNTLHSGLLQSKSKNAEKFSIFDDSLAIYPIALNEHGAVLPNEKMTRKPHKPPIGRIRNPRENPQNPVLMPENTNLSVGPSSGKLLSKQSEVIPQLNQENNAQNRSVIFAQGSKDKVGRTNSFSTKRGRNMGEGGSKLKHRSSSLTRLHSVNYCDQLMPTVFAAESKIQSIDDAVIENVLQFNII